MNEKKYLGKRPQRVCGSGMMYHSDDDDDDDGDDDDDDDRKKTANGSSPLEFHNEDWGSKQHEWLIRTRNYGLNQPTKEISRLNYI